MENIIVKDEEVVGYSWDLEEYVSHFPDEDELLAELKKHDGLVLCWYHPMGAWVVKDLVEQ